MIQINKFEKRLSSFHNYTFDRYCTLQLIDFYLKSYVNNDHVSTDKQVLIDISFEIENEIESLQHMQYCEDKNTEFRERVECTLNIIKRLKKYSPNFEASDLSKDANAWEMFEYNIKHHRFIIE